MDVTTKSGTALVARVQGILLRPSTEWRAIDAEKTEAAALYRSYVIPLAAIGPIATFIGAAIFGQSVPFVGTVRVPIVSALVQAIVSYALALAAPYVLALVIDTLAPSFGATRDRGQALKVAVYSSTAAWLAGVFGIVPALGILSILGLYSLYLLYVGLPILMKAPAEKATAYTASVVLAAIVVFVVIGIVATSLGGLAA